MFDFATPENFDAASEASWSLNEVTYPSKTTGADRKCFVVLPKDYTAEKTYPVFYLLHGIGGTETEWLGGCPADVLGNLSAAGKIKDMIVVIPNVRAMKDDRVPEEVFGPVNIAAFDNFINDLRDDLMPFIAAHYSIKTGRENTAIAGLSMGGRESLYIGTVMPETFGYVGAFSPAPGLLPLSKLSFPGQLTKESFTFREETGIPKFLMICYGEQDMIVMEVAAEYHQTLLHNGIEHLCYTMPGGHDFNVWKNGLYHFSQHIF